MDWNFHQEILLLICNFDCWKFWRVYCLLWNIIICIWVTICIIRLYTFPDQLENRNIQYNEISCIVKLDSVAERNRSWQYWWQWASWKVSYKISRFSKQKVHLYLCKISLKFWLYMYLFSSPSVPLLIEQVLNVYLLQTIVHFIGGKILWWSSTSSAGISDVIPVPGGQTSFKCINNYNFIFGMYLFYFS